MPGHDHAALAGALRDPVDGPCAVVARTIKGHGVGFMENELMWHYRSLREEDRAPRPGRARPGGGMRDAFFEALTELAPTTSASGR